MSGDPPPPGYWETSKSDLGGAQPQPGGGPPGDLLGCFDIKKSVRGLGSSFYAKIKLLAKIFFTSSSLCMKLVLYRLSTRGASPCLSGWRRSSFNKMTLFLSSFLLHYHALDHEHRGH